MTLVIDNYDSFTWNLAQAFMMLGEEVRVVRNDEIDVEQAEAMDFDRLVVSPGPGAPAGAGRSVELVRHFAGRKPVLGVCLGHQAIGYAFGAPIVRAARIMHGKTDLVSHDGRGLFADLPNPLRVVRYHSLCIDRNGVPEGFEVTARSQDGEIMGIANRALGLCGVQFHPESAASEEGLRLLGNFLSGAGERPSVRSMLRRLSSRESLTGEEAESFMDRMAEGLVSPAQAGAFLSALTVKGPTIEEISGFATALRRRAVPVPLPPGMEVTDTCGTGGDASNTFNISTAAAIVACGAGVRIAKHGNRSVTSRSGSADLLEALGVRIDLAPEEAARAIVEQGMAFLFAPAYHPAFGKIAGARREVGFRTVFNMIGPLINPARVGSQVLGVYDPSLTRTAAAVLVALGVRRALVVHGMDGVDEISLAARTSITEVRDGWIRDWVLDPAEYGFSPCEAADLKGGDAAENAQIVERVLAGEAGPKRDIVVLNAAAAIYVSAADPGTGPVPAGAAMPAADAPGIRGPGPGLRADFTRAVEAAKASIDSGRAAAALERLRAAGRKGAGVPREGGA